MASPPSPTTIYLDYNATTPIAPEAAQALALFLSPGLTGAFGNPSSSHAAGQHARQALEHARTQVAGLLGAPADTLHFCGGGTESCNHVLKGVVMAAWLAGGRATPVHVVTSVIEHPAVKATLAWLEAAGFSTTTAVGVDSTGRVSAADVAAALTPTTVLVTVMTANNETGTVQPIADIVAAVRASAASAASPRGIFVHTDASQAAGKLPLSVARLGVDALTIAGHKLYAPKGVGATYLARGCSIPSLLHGAGQEAGVRAGTENVALAVALGAAAEVAAAHLAAAAAVPRSTAAPSTRDALVGALLRGCEREGLRLPVVHGPLAGRVTTDANGTTVLQPPHAGAYAGADAHPEWPACLPNTLFVSFPGAPAGALLHHLRDLVACSAGAACHTLPAAAGAPPPHGAPLSPPSGGAIPRPSPSLVLAAMGVDDALAACTLRFSTGRWTTWEEVARAAELVVAAVVAVGGARVVTAAPSTAGKEVHQSTGVVAAVVGLEAPPPVNRDVAASTNHQQQQPPALLLRTIPLFLTDTHLYVCGARVLGVAWADDSPSSVVTTSPLPSPSGGGASTVIHLLPPRLAVQVQVAPAAAAGWCSCHPTSLLPSSPLGGMSA